ncbi:MAG: hypothetical protein PHS92_03525 [Candidatus Gracilibacteria bacterium]|nr:hypothetical protein [Candidatus Gracilibacteria bacterium]
MNSNTISGVVATVGSQDIIHILPNQVLKASQKPDVLVELRAKIASGAKLTAMAELLVLALGLTL